MERLVQADGRLVKRNILARPLEPDVMVTCVFRRTAQELLKSEASGIAEQPDSKSSVAREVASSGGAGLARNTIAGCTPETLAIARLGALTGTQTCHENESVARKHRARRILTLEVFAGLVVATVVCVVRACAM
jgi:hypothetical protein